AGNLYDLVQTRTHLYASFDSGVFRSADGGVSWDCVFPTDGKTIYRIATSGQKLYAVKGFVGC
ncbi:MAG: hypothetical protein JNK89_01555, partial [Saprospiraceae bacterium]|nr:hypothetical protein [Saprospiraceae bacterium]